MSRPRLPVRTLAAAALLALPMAGDAQSWSLEAGTALATPLLDDGNGTRVTLAPAAVVGVALAPRAWRLGPARVALEARVASAGVRLADGGARWSGGRAWQAELLAMARRADPARVTPLAGVGLTWLGGAARVRVLDDLGARPRPVIAGGALLRPQAASRTALAVVAQGMRVSPADGDAGGVLRVLLTVRHAW